MTMRALALALTLFLGVSSAAAQKAGDRAVPFELKDLAGKKVKLGDLKGKVVMLDFWASWCKPCKKELPALDVLQKKYAKNVVILAINIDKDRAKAEKFLREAGIANVRVLLDPDSSVASQYDLPTMPTSYILDKKGIIRHVHAGYESGDEKTVAKQFEALIKAQ